MSLAENAISHKTLSWMAVVLLVVGGVISFLSLGRLEDPAFTLKQALVITQYPGASALEVEEEITLPIENAIQQLPYVKRVTSTSSAGLSQVEVEMKSTYRKDDLAQIWDEMRRKIRDMQSQLPPGAYPPIINDDFGDVYGVFLAITGDGYSYEELAYYTDFLRRELVLINGVGKVTAGGRLAEKVFIEIDRSKLAASGLSIDAIKHLLQGQSLVSDAGKITVGSEYLRISSIAMDSQGLETLSGLLLSGTQEQLIYLGDIATIYKGYEDPASHLYRFNGKQALTLGVSFSENVNVVKIGELIDQRLNALNYARPIGMDINTIYNQPKLVERSVNDFLVSLAQAVVIVIIVLMLAMGWRPGIIMSATLLLNIAGTFIVMNMYNIELHRISLGALIIALGMLVDNAIVITEGIMISLQRGLSRVQSAVTIVSNTRWPLLGATFIAIVAFAPIGLSPDASGEFTGSLFWVLFISLLLSWILAITITPFFCFLMFKRDERNNSTQQQALTAPNNQDTPYKGRLFQLYSTFLNICLHYRWATLIVMFGLLLSALVAFGKVKQAFFPESPLPLYMVDYWLPEGTSIQVTESDIKSLEQKILNMDGVSQVTATIGRGADRFMLTYEPEKSYSSYAQLLVHMDSFDEVTEAIEKTKNLILHSYPQAFALYRRPAIGPSSAAKIEARIIGPDPDTLRILGDQVIEIFRENTNVINIRHDWRERTKVLHPIIDTAAARRLGINQAHLDAAMQTHLNGQTVGVFRDGSEVLPILMRPPQEERKGVDQLKQIQVYSPVTQSYINIGQFMNDVSVQWEDPIIKRVNRKRTLSVLADPDINSNAFALHSELNQAIKTLTLPPGYALEWGGEYEDQQEANTAVFAFLPLGIVVMIVINIFMFNSLRQTLVVWITVPLAIVGVAYGLLLTGAPFSFIALLAVLSLIGMQIKNGIVLVEEIKRLNTEEQIPWLQAIQMASLSRLRPVSMAALTTILGMIPLLSDVFFQPMAVTIMFGLGFATLLTLIVVPVLFALFYQVSSKREIAH
ncbi:efflux RND transporter permease subunit [Marinagarivorans algicola]|uniref:efflux RND transporter permease subunit n=1 Tax=Marinagarivorans algicola TaxID=1513270 RepID=UPI0006B4A8C1|nr:efflux RND transporter permease subunit [Marinagarivorans algicola]